MNTPLLKLPADALSILCRKCQVRELALFGSAARGDQTAGSDLDFLVEFEPQARVGFLALSGLSRELSVLTHCPVDLVPKAGLKQTIRDQVLAEAKVICVSQLLGIGQDRILQSERVNSLAIKVSRNTACLGDSKLRLF